MSKLAISLALALGLALSGCAQMYGSPWPAEDFKGYKGVGGP